MTNPLDLELNLYIFILAGFLGYRIISRVPPLLHTPLMSATNALSGISLIGSLVVAGRMESTLSTILGCIAVACSSTNVVGGFYQVQATKSVGKVASVQVQVKPAQVVPDGA